MAYHCNPWMILPFALWLALLALAPLHFSKFWKRHYGKLSLLFAAPIIGYYFFALPAEAFQTVIHTAHDFLSFIVLIGSLYIVSGGIYVTVEGEGTPWVKVCFLALGGVLANLLGTTGASMLLIRPWLQLTKSRAGARHVVFFIFIVANIGGGLTPIGDPPLLVGYLKGVPFWWVWQHCWAPWLLTMGLLLGVFYAMELRDYPRTRQSSSLRWHCEGLWNLAFLAVIVGALFVSRPSFLREGLMLAAAAGSFLFTGKKIHEANQFDFEPIVEVAVLFFGIFATIIPALDWLRINAHTILGADPHPALVYWSSGGLSSILDSAPAYLAFASALGGVFGGMEPLLQKGAAHVVALSVATVFFGAVTYVGNGPNLMVKAIVERQGIPAPTFFGYLFKWAVPILLPLLLIIWVIFVRQ